MTKITFPNGSVKGPPKLDAVQQAALIEWLPANDPQGLEGDMERFAHWRNVYRAAESYGPSMVSLMMDLGAMSPEQDPVEALRKLLKESGF